MELDAGDAALAGIASGLHGASQGLSQGIQNAQAIQSTDASRQNMAIQADLLKRTQAEEAKQNAPVYKDDVAKRVPRELQGWWNDKTQGQWQKGADGREFMPQRDYAEHKETMNNFDKHQGIVSGIEFMGKENAKIEEDPIIKQAQALAADKQKEIEAIKSNPDILDKTAKLLSIDKKYKKILEDHPEETKKYQEMIKQYKENQQKIGAYQGKLNGADAALKEVIKKNPGVNPDDIMIVWGGDKPNDPEGHQNYMEAQQRVQASMSGGSKPLSDIGKLIADRDKYPIGDPQRQPFEDEIKKKSGTDQSMTEEQLTAKALKGDKEAQSVLDAMQKRKIDIAKTMKVAQQQAQGGTAFKDLAPDEKENAYKNFILNKVAPSFGMGANPDRKEWNAGLNKWMVANKITPEDVATGRAAVKFQAATGTLQNKAILATVDPLLDELTKTGKALGNSNIQGWNYLKNTFKEATGHPDIVAFKNLRDDTIAEVERGLLNTGVLSDTKYIRAAKNVADAQSFPQLQAAVKNMRIVIKARLDSIAKMSVPPSNLQSGVAGAATHKYIPGQGIVEIK